MKKITKLKRTNIPRFAYSIVRKTGSNEVVEVQKINIKTGKKEIISQNKDYKKLVDKIKKK